jgi:hypothetical protein
MIIGQYLPAGIALGGGMLMIYIIWQLLRISRKALDDTRLS